MHYVRVHKDVKIGDVVTTGYSVEKYYKVTSVTRATTPLTSSDVVNSFQYYPHLNYSVGDLGVTDIRGTLVCDCNYLTDVKEQYKKDNKGENLRWNYLLIADIEQIMNMKETKLSNLRMEMDRKHKAYDGLVSLITSIQC